MKNLLTILLFVGMLAVVGCAQSRTNRIYRPCPSTAGLARVDVQRTGDIDLVPCVGRDVLINGLPSTFAFTVSGSSRTNFFPYFSTETNLAKSPFSWNGTTYTWNNTAANSNFTATLITSAASAGRWQIGDLVNGDNYFEFSDATGNGDWAAATRLTLLAPQIHLGFGTNTAQVRFADTSTAPTYMFARTITAGGTTGNQTINKPVGTVNFAAAASSLTVTNSTVLSTSIVLATARTNDANCAVKNVVSGAGSFVINMTAACAAETSVGFLVLN